MAFASTRGKLDVAQDQIAQLRAQVQALANDRLTPAVNDYAGRAGDAFNAASGVAQQQANVVAGRVNQQPLIAILIAASLGWVVGRFMR